MLTLEYKLGGSRAQFAAIDEAIRTVQFIRNTCLRLWMDQRGIRGVTASDLQAHCAVLAQRFPFAARLNSQARQQAADRAWAAISRFYAACRTKTPGRKGYPRFQRTCRSVEYKVTGWALEADGRHIRFTDGHGVGRLRLVGTRRIETYPSEQIKRVRLVRRADGYFVQFCVQAERHIVHTATGKQLGIDVGLAVFVTDSDGNAAPNPRYLRAAEHQLKRLHRRVSCKRKGSKNRGKARQRLARAYLHVQRQREDHARKLAGALISSCDWIAFEDLQIRNLVKNRSLAKSISDAGWARFRWWVELVGGALRPAARHRGGGGATTVDQPGLLQVWGAGAQVLECAHASLPALWVGVRPGPQRRREHLAGVVCGGPYRGARGNGRGQPRERLGRAAPLLAARKGGWYVCSSSQESPG